MRAQPAHESPLYAIRTPPWLAFRVTCLNLHKFGKMGEYATLRPSIWPRIHLQCNYTLVYRYEPTNKRR
jgi:hypothetical protein